MAQLLIEITPEIENVLQNKAAQQGQTLAEYMTALAVREAAQANVGTPVPGHAPRLTAAAVRGKYAGKGASVKEFLRERHEEAQVEEQRFQERLLVD